MTNSGCTTKRPSPRPTGTNCRPLTASNPSPRVLALHWPLPAWATRERRPLIGPSPQLLTSHWPLPARTGREGRSLIGPGRSSPGEGEDRHKWGGTARGGAGPQGAASSLPGGPSCPFPSPLGVRLPALKEPEPCRAVAPGVLLGAECLSSCSWSWGRRGGGLVATGGLVLVGMLSAVLVIEPGEKDVVRRMGKEKGRGGLLGGRTS